MKTVVEIVTKTEAQTEIDITPIVDPITILLETTIKTDPDMINIIDIVTPDQIHEITLILVIDHQATVIETTQIHLETTNIHTAVLLNQDNIIDQDITVLIQTPDPTINPPSIM